MLEGNDRITLYLQPSISCVVKSNLALPVIPSIGSGHKILSYLFFIKEKLVETLRLFLCQVRKTRYDLFKRFREGCVTAD